MTDNRVKLFFNKLDYLKNSSDRILIRSNIVKQFLGDVNNVKILDIGCGDGSLSLQFLNKSNLITFVDISDKMLEVVKEKIPVGLVSNTVLINDSFDAVSDDESFDVIICVGVIAHVPSVELLFKKIATILKPGGLLVLETTPNPYPIGKLLFPYYFIRGLVVGNSSKYNKNRLKINDLLLITNSIGLVQLQSVRYSFPLPGMTHWPQALKLRYTLFTLNNKIMSRLGTEHILLFKKQ
ncbi:MAG: methyltransferase domain-containing protein [Methylotenera sp.]